jgi:UDP-N-acetylmuramate dehydrogenase
MHELPNLRTNVVIAPLTTYQIGGPADYFVEVTSSAELITAVGAARAANVPFFILGTGANILVSDKGYRGLVIHNRANRIEIEEAARTITAESGATMAEVIAAATAGNLGELEYFTLIPSSVGGAVRQNLHFVAVDSATWAETGELVHGETQYLGDRVKSGKLLDETSKVVEWSHDEFGFQYDYSAMLVESVILLEATFTVVPRSRDDITRQTAATTAWRRAKQPQLDEVPSCGSVFMKIEGVGAGRLIEQVGLKGHRIGGAEVSTKHANYLVNRDHAAATEVRQLIELVQAKVLAVTGYKLETEIGFVGEWE